MGKMTISCDVVTPPDRNTSSYFSNVNFRRKSCGQSSNSLDADDGIVSTSIVQNKVGGHTFYQISLFCGIRQRCQFIMDQR